MGHRRRGDVAQLGEHLLCKEGVRGSSPLISTTLRMDAFGLVASVGRLDPIRCAVIDCRALFAGRTAVRIASRIVVTGPIQSDPLTAARDPGSRPTASGFLR